MPIGVSKLFRNQSLKSNTFPQSIGFFDNNSSAKCECLRLLPPPTKNAGGNGTKGELSDPFELFTQRAKRESTFSHREDPTGRRAIGKRSRITIYTDDSGGGDSEGIPRCLLPRLSAHNPRHPHQPPRTPMPSLHNRSIEPHDTTIEAVAIFFKTDRR